MTDSNASQNRKVLDQLYPFLDDNSVSEKSDEVLLQSIAFKASESIRVKHDFFDQNGKSILEAARTLAKCYTSGGRMFTMGNGGSSCDASHLAVEFQHPVTTGRPALPAHNLTIDTAYVSAVGNDIGMEHVFARQLENLGREGDVLVGFSTSGNSQNLIAGFRKAIQMNISTIGLCGGDGGDMSNGGYVEQCLIVPSDSIHRVQEVHVACYHILWDITHTLMADSRRRQP